MKNNFSLRIIFFIEIKWVLNTQLYGHLSILLPECHYQFETFFYQIEANKFQWKIFSSLILSGNKLLFSNQLRSTLRFPRNRKYLLERQKLFTARLSNNSNKTSCFPFFFNWVHYTLLLYQQLAIIFYQNFNWF